ncbi:MAG: MoaD/ThiS family protein [Cytophagales bacterium]|nr:MoaD/ThiS family protein [Cytophagales bacterium]
MQLTIKYLGMLAETTRCSEEAHQATEKTVSELLESLYRKYPALREKDFQVAQNHRLVSTETELDSGELALLPPFAGG